MRIGEIAELAGVTTRTVRHYHRIGLLPEPMRRPNGYRAYELRDAVRLVRIRRLVQLGLNLDEVLDALADDDGRELREILIGLHGDLLAQEARLRAQRERIELLLADAGDLSASPELTETMSALSRVAGTDHPSLERERMVLHLLEPLAQARAPEFWHTYQSVLADPELAEPLLEAMRRFEQLADLAPEDPAVDALAGQARDVVAAAVCATSPTPQAVDPTASRSAELLLEAVSTDLAPAQARCLQLMVRHWRQVSS